MIRFFILIYGLSLTEAYTIKVSGQVELGSQLSKLFKELYAQLGENGMTGDLGNGYVLNEDGLYKFQREPTRSQESDDNVGIEKKRKKHKGKKKHKETDERDVPILDKMMQNDLEKLHLYGSHKFQEGKTGEPLNNVHL